MSVIRNLDALEIVEPNALPDRVVAHERAPRWVWDETFNRPDGRTFRVSRIPSGEGGSIREEIVHERNLGACVADLAGVPGVCTVLVYEQEEE